MPGTLPTRSQLQEAVRRGDFWWAAGIEDTFITTPHPVTGRTLDEYELTAHYRRWAEDIDLMAGLGITAARYGVPWHRLQPTRDTWSWEYADGPLERLLDHGISPQVDLVHYGLPDWIEGGFLNPAYPDYVAEYAARLADRFRGRIHWYTPLNEPRITAWYCGRIGWWPPFMRSPAGFVRVMLAVCRGIVKTVRSLEAVDPEILAYHVDATDLFAADTADLDDLAGQRQSQVLLALDLLSGAVDEAHPLRGWLLTHGARAAELDAFRERPLELGIIGLNLYPMFTQKRIVRDAAGRLRVRMPYASGELIERLAAMYHARYRAPLTISETASLGSVRRRIAWLEESVAAVRRLRERGVPMAGYTWWPLFSLVAWAYRQGRRPASSHLLRMGLFDLDPDPAADLARRRTPAADAYAGLAGGGAGSAGPLALPLAA